MRCFVVKGKHIIFAITAVLSLSVMSVWINAVTQKDVPVFKNEDLISEILPSDEKPVLMKKIKSYMDKEINSDSKSILNKYSPMFDEESAEAVPEDTLMPVCTEIASEAPKVENKSINGNIAKLQNATDYQVDAEDYKNEPYSFPENGKVLIVHTHTTESYIPENILADNSRNTDETQNMIAIGEVFRCVLEENGISVIHDKTFHDYPSYQGSYTRSFNTIKQNISDDPQIVAVLDIHRDAIIKDDGTRVKLSTNVNGKEYAQLMVVCGTDSMGLSHPDWRSNLNFGIKITEKAESIIPGLMRPLNLREERFNQHLTKNSLIIEVGTNGNTLDEAKNGAEVFAKAVAEVINEAKR